MRHLNNGTDHCHSKSCCDQSSPARRTINDRLYRCILIKILSTMNTLINALSVDKGVKCYYRAAQNVVISTVFFWMQWKRSHGISSTSPVVRPHPWTYCKQAYTILDHFTENMSGIMDRASVWYRERPVHRHARLIRTIMMTTLNGNIFRVTGPLCWEFTGQGRIPLTKASNAEL